MRDSRVSKSFTGKNLLLAFLDWWSVQELPLISNYIFRQHPDEVTVPMSIEFEELKKYREKGDEKEGKGDSEAASALVEFTDEEGYGKFLDLHECYEKFINLKGADKIDYVT